MTYYPDLSRYEYYRGVFDRPRTLNVGWLAREHTFDVAPLSRVDSSGRKADGSGPLTS